MENRCKIGFYTKWLSHRNYLSEVSVEGKSTHTFFRKMLRFDVYARQIIRTGSCITLVSNPMKITTESFFNLALFDDYVKFVFLTFNNSFLTMLKERIEELKLEHALHCLSLLHQNFEPYKEYLKNDDEELAFCILKKNNLATDVRFATMFELDKGNRQAILKSLEERIHQIYSQRELADPTDKVSIPLQAIPDTLSFVQMLQPVNDSTQETLNFIKSCMERARFRFDIFLPANKTAIDRNPKGFNGAVGAMIAFFYELGYFKPEHSIPDIFDAYFSFTGNSIPKFNGTLRFFDYDTDYLNCLTRLRKLGISKLQRR